MCLCEWGKWSRVNSPFCSVCVESLLFLWRCSLIKRLFKKSPNQEIYSLATKQIDVGPNRLVSCVEVLPIARNSQIIIGTLFRFFEFEGFGPFSAGMPVEALLDSLVSHLGLKMCLRRFLSGLVLDLTRHGFSPSTSASGPSGLTWMV